MSETISCWSRQAYKDEVPVTARRQPNEEELKRKKIRRRKEDILLAAELEREVLGEVWDE